MKSTKSTYSDRIRIGRGFFLKYIEKWENRYDNIPNYEPIIVSKLAYESDYMPWFRIHDKLYLLSKE